MLNHLTELSDKKSRSISPENFSGEKGKGGMATEGTGAAAARDLGQGWKISPSVIIKSGRTFTMADIEGPGTIEQMWLTPTSYWRFSILRIYWDDQEHPSVECPIGDFFACGWGQFAQLSSLAICVNPGSALNCYWPMPFKKRCRMTLENLAEEDMVLHYQVNYAEGSVSNQPAYFHAQFRRSNPLPYGEVYTLLDGVKGHGHYAGTYMAWGVNNSGWWGEGEIKFFLDGDKDFPSICGTGTEDYFCGSYDFVNKQTDQYQEYTTPYAGMPQVLRPDSTFKSQMRFGLYRWHITDPVRFQRDLRINIQALGWRRDRRYLPLQDDISSVAYWYQSLPSAPFPKLPDKDYLEII